MADLIDRQAAMDILHECGGDEIYPPNMVEMRGKIYKLSAVDAVEVVRCKDCKYSMLWRKPTDGVIGDCWIRKMNSDDEQFPMVGAYDFCSYGERREENG